jgi:hypothetical protein
MTEITAVPIKPIAKGSLTKLWIGVILAMLVGAGLAWAAVPRGLDVDTQVAGTGDMPKLGDVMFLKYKGKLAADGTMFDESRDIPLPVEGIFPEGTPFPIEEGQTIPGFFEGLQQMQKGGKYTLFIPAEKAYGAGQCRSGVRNRSDRHHEPADLRTEPRHFAAGDAGPDGCWRPRRPARAGTGPVRRAHVGGQGNRRQDRQSGAHQHG